MMRLLVPLAGSMLTMGCMMRPPAPLLPERVVPAAAASVMPAEPPEGKSGRVILDAVDDKAKVFDVTELTELTPQAMSYRGTRSWAVTPVVETKMRPLCVTPCVVDLPQGLHSFVFHSTTDETKTSTADVSVPAQPIVVRHALGREKPVSGAYIGGLFMIPVAGAFTLFGGFATAIGATARDPGPSEIGKSKSDPKAFLSVGLVLLGVGAVLGITGSIVAVATRPEQQPGSTTQWVLVP